MNKRVKLALKIIIPVVIVALLIPLLAFAAADYMMGDLPGVSKIKTTFSVIGLALSGKDYIRMADMQYVYRADKEMQLIKNEFGAAYGYNHEQKELIPVDLDNYAGHGYCIKDKKGEVFISRHSMYSSKFVVLTFEPYDFIENTYSGVE